MSPRLTRRTFLSGSGSVLALGGAQRPRGIPESVNFWVDGVLPSPAEFADALTALTKEDPDIKDRFGRGGAVARLETEMARLLGKERGLYLPTGTMANQLALKVLSHGAAVVYAQQESHVVRDEAAAAERAHGRRVVPFDEGEDSLAQALAGAVERATGSAARGGAVSIEVPLRRAENEVSTFGELGAVHRYARDRDMGLHLDGARLLLASEYTGIAPSAYAALFDTVYVSLYKYLRAPAGAILCGSAAVLDRVSQLRRVHGGDLYQHWPYASVALHFLRDFSGRYARARARADELFERLESSGRFHVRRRASGSNIVRLEVVSADAAGFRGAARQRGLKLHAPSDDGLIRVHVNETQLAVDPATLARAFVDSHEAAGRG